MGNQLLAIFFIIALSVELQCALISLSPSLDWYGAMQNLQAGDVVELSTGIQNGNFTLLTFDRIL